MPEAERRSTDRYEATYMDLPGSGHASRPVSPEVWHSLMLVGPVRVIDRTRAAIGNDAILLLGHSPGSVVAEEYALPDSSGTLGLVLVSAYPAFDYVLLAVELARCLVTPALPAALQAALGAPVEDKTSLATVGQDVRGHYLGDAGDDRIACAVAEQRLSATAFDWGVRHVLPAFSVLTRLPEPAVPSLILAGDDEWLWHYMATTSRLAAVLYDVAVLVFRKGSQFLVLEQSVEWERFTRDWLGRRVWATGASAAGPTRAPAAPGGA